MYISLLFLWLTACSQPVSIEMFAPMGEELVLDMSDSLCTYDISFFTRADFPAFSRTARAAGGVRSCKGVDRRPRRAPGGLQRIGPLRPGTGMPVPDPPDPQNHFMI